MISTYMFRFSLIIGVVIILATIVFGYLFFEPFLTEKEETITVINIEKWGGENGRYFIFTEDEVFLNADDYYQNKHNADEMYRQLRKGYTYKVKVVGIYMSFIPRFRNILQIIESSSNDYYSPK
jgi:hypothetical protein